LYLSVHSRLLAAVEGNHGNAFRRILNTLEIPHEQIILQLPLITPSQRWVLTHVAENYRRNGFRIGVNASTLEQAGDLLDRIRPDAIKIDISAANHAPAQISLLQRADQAQCNIIFRRIENEARLLSLQQANDTASPYLVGFLFDLPKATLVGAQCAASSASMQARPLRLPGRNCRAEPHCFGCSVAAVVAVALVTDFGLAICVYHLKT
jgi:EAL domain-containing protein (putative c-di-GMP-specific phosphodiesterase class I)